MIAAQAIPATTLMFVRLCNTNMRNDRVRMFIPLVPRLGIDLHGFALFDRGILPFALPEIACDEPETASGESLVTFGVPKIALIAAEMRFRMWIASSGSRDAGFASMHSLAAALRQPVAADSLPETVKFVMRHPAWIATSSRVSDHTGRYMRQSRVITPRLPVPAAARLAATANL